MDTPVTFVPGGLAHRAGEGLPAVFVRHGLVGPQDRRLAEVIAPRPVAR